MYKSGTCASYYLRSLQVSADCTLAGLGTLAADVDLMSRWRINFEYDQALGVSVKKLTSSRKAKVTAVGLSVSDHEPAAAATSNCSSVVHDCFPSKIGAITLF